MASPLAPLSSSADAGSEPHRRRPVSDGEFLVVEDGPRQVLEQRVHLVARLGGGLHPLAAQLDSLGLTGISADLSEVVQVSLAAHQDSQQLHVVLLAALATFELLLPLLHILECFPVCDVVGQQDGLGPAVVERPNGCKLLLASRVPAISGRIVKSLFLTYFYDCNFYYMAILTRSEV